jgi:hypothetical protein
MIPDFRNLANFPIFRNLENYSNAFIIIALREMGGMARRLPIGVYHFCGKDNANDAEKSFVAGFTSDRFVPDSNSRVLAASGSTERIDSVGDEFGLDEGSVTEGSWVAASEPTLKNEKNVLTV